MKKAVLFVIVAVLLAIGLPAFAQEFPDVPPDHWAYDAVQELVNAGIIQGYPDGTYGGKRAMSRYEFAEAVAKAIPAIEERIKASLPSGGPGGVGPAGPAGPAGAPGVGAEELAALRKLVDEFRDELAALGVDVEALRRDVAALNERVTALEEEVARVRFAGEVNLIGRGEVENNPSAIDIDSRPLAAGTTGTAQADNLLPNSSVFTDLDFGMKARVSEDGSVNVLINAGDYLTSQLGTGDFTLWNLYFDGALKLGPLGAAQVVVGRYPFQLTPLTLKLVDPDSYTNVTKLDSGDYVFDGGRASFNLGRVALTAFAGKAQPIADLISPKILGTDISQLAGARAVIGLGSAANLGLTFYQAGLVGGQSQVMGADINTSLGSLGIAAEFAQSDLSDSLVPGGLDDNSAWTAKLSYQAGRLGISGGFDTIEQNYFAPGYWYDLGRAVNLVNVEGPNVGLTFGLGSNLRLTADARFLEPNDTTASVDARTSINQGPVVSVGGAALDKLTYWKAGLQYGLTAANSIDLGWEEVKWEPTAGGDTTERYISIGLGHSFNPNASLKLLYQIISYEEGALTPYGATGDYRGGVATAQFQLKY